VSAAGPQSGCESLSSGLFDILCWSEPSAFTEKTRPPLKSKTNKRPTRVVSDLEEIRELKQKTGKDIYAVGGAILVSALINHVLVDEIRLMVNPVLLGGGKALFNGLTERKHLKLESAEQRGNGKVYLIYSVQSK
jgi:dihydrofolate reductase